MKAEEYLAKLGGDDLADTLSTFSNAELDPLYKILVKPASQTLSHSERVQKFHPNHQAYARLMAAEVCEFGGNSFANVARGFAGPSYREVVRDVCRSQKVKVDESMSVVEMEQALLAHLFSTLPENERAEILAEAAERFGFSPDLVTSTGISAAIAAQVGSRAAGFMLYRTSLQVVNLVSRLVLKRGLSFAGNQMLVRALGAATGPIGWFVSGVLAAKEIAAPALRVTTPCVVLIAGTRQTKLWQHSLKIAA